MAGFIRRYTADPGMDEILAIEGVVIIDREPPAQLTGVGTGMVTLIAEFEDGDFETPYQVASSADFLNAFGGFGYTYNGTPSNNPCARTRYADATLVPEYWNGNGFIALTKKKFRQLNVVRVDTSVGYVEMRRLAYLTGASDFTFNLEPANSFVFNAGGGNATATFSATAATVLSAVGVYASTFVGGEVLIFKIDGTTYTCVFEVTDQLQTAVVARLNATAGYTAFINAGAGKTSITARRRGTGSSVEIITGSTALALTATGFSVAAATAGTGNVANIGAVTEAEVNSICVAAAGVAVPAFVVAVTRDESNKLLISNTSTPLTGTLAVVSCSATGLGFVTGQASTAVTGIAGSIPAGTRVRNAGAVEWVTMQSTPVTAASAGPYHLHIRHASDITTGALANAATITTLPYPVPGLGMFSVTNPLPTTAALTEAQLDAKYQTAIDTTKNLSSIVRQTNIIVSARASNVLRTALRTNAVDASSEGCFGRMAIIRPPLKATRAAAKSAAAQPGVGTYRNGRVIYAYPGVQIYCPQIAAVGTAGGAGFTASGNIDVGFDMWVASVCSQLPPEENPGQSTSYLTEILGVEAGNTDVQNLVIGDYRAFKAAGIAAMRMEQGVAIIQTGCTSVDPLAYPSLKNINRQRMADFITDTLSLRLNTFSKQLATRVRRALIVGEIDSFMSTLSGAANPATQRIEGYLIDAISANTPETLAAGIFRVLLRVRTLPSMDVIVLDTMVGESVSITQLAA